MLLIYKGYSIKRVHQLVKLYLFTLLLGEGFPQNVMMISLGITNPLAAFVNRQPESINQRDARFPAVALLQLPAVSLLQGTALWGTSFPLSLEELCTLALAFIRAGDPI